MDAEKVKTFAIGGRTITLSNQQVRNAMRGQVPLPIREYWVVVGGSNYPPKQVLEVATGFDRSTFTSHEAIRVLTALDIDVHAHSEMERFSVRTSRASDESWYVNESPIAPAPGKRATSLGPTEMYLLRQWGRQISEGLEEMAYLVGSCARGEPWRDIDVRVMVDEPHPFLIPGRLQVINVAFTVWGQRVTGLPIDFQIQPTAEANALYGGQRRNALFVSSED